MPNTKKRIAVPAQLRKLVHKRAKKTGAAPGTLIHSGEKKTERARIRVIDYDQDKLERREYDDASACCPLLETSTVSWINIDGLHQVEIIETIGRCFNLHPLVMEDILNTDQRPKVEAYDDYVFIVLKMLTFNEQTGETLPEQVSLILGRNFVLSFQEREGDVFEGVRERLRSGRRIRFMGADYLTYALLDAIVDSYLLTLEKISDQIELLEEELMERPTPQTLDRIHHFKREMILLRKSVWPLRELIGGLTRGEHPLVTQETILFLRDVYDHTIHVIDTVETFRDLLGGMTDLYLSSVSHRMNEVMKVLTLIATIFIPLTFIAGVYGMNFEYMPELQWRWGYPAVWAVMILVGILMVGFFKRKKWL